MKFAEDELSRCLESVHLAGDHQRDVDAMCIVAWTAYRRGYSSFDSYLERNILVSYSWHSILFIAYFFLIFLKADETVFLPARVEEKNSRDTKAPGSRRRRRSQRSAWRPALSVDALPPGVG